MRSATEGAGIARMGSPPEAQVTAQRRRVLVVEDELMIRMLLEDMLSELGYTVSAAASRLDEAMQAVQAGEFDIAILDVNLNGEPISPLADVLAARGTPFVFATGYDEGAYRTAIATGRRSKSHSSCTTSSTRSRRRLRPFHTQRKIASSRPDSASKLPCSL